LRQDDLSDWGGGGSDNDRKDHHLHWKITREKILMYSGLTLVGASFINSEILGGVFHYEFLIAGLALCGISIAQWGDRRSSSN
jgi:hypothetical protein